jgi:effector-binding domain-containing protein
VKTLPSFDAACIRGRVSAGRDQAGWWKELNDSLKRKGLVPIAPGYTIYHEVSDRDSDIEIVQPVEKSGADSGRIRFRRTEPFQVAAVVVKGPQDQMEQSYALLRKWISENGCRKIGPNREYYYRRDWNESDPLNWLTEIQIPIELAKDGADVLKKSIDN